MRPAFSVLGLAGGLALLNGVFWLRNISKLLTECSFKFDLEILSMLPNNSSHEATGHSTLPVVVLATVLITLRTVNIDFRNLQNWLPIFQESMIFGA
jgi:hypothetical protein